MPKFKNPDITCTSISIGGDCYKVKDGVVEVPDDGDFATLLHPHGFRPHVEEQKQEEQKQEEQETRKPQNNNKQSGRK